jgi:sn-glycerol 3-phosphate transport system substrate-binding protein
LTGPAGDAQDELVKMFNASQNRIQVTSEFQGSYTDLATKLLAAVGAGGGPQVTQLGTYEIRQFAKSKVLVDLKPFITGPNGIDTKDWFGTIVQAGEVDGGIYWLPFNVSVPVLYYNKEAFAAAGLTAPPKTWDEFFQYARKLTVKDDKGVVKRYGLALWNISWPFQSAIWSEGGEITSRDYKNITLNDPKIVKVLTEFQNLIKEGAAIMPDPAAGGHRGMFKNGQAAMILDSPAPFGEIFQQSVGFTPAVAHYPAGAAGKVYAPGGGGIAMVATTPKEKQEAAWEFMKFMLSPKSIAYYAEKSGYVAFTKAAQKEMPLLTKDERYAILNSAAEFIRGDFSPTMSPAVRNAFDTALQKILMEKADVKATLDAADAKAEKDIKEESFSQ